MLKRWLYNLLGVAPKMRPGVLVEITETTEQPVFDVGDRARLLYQDKDGSWWADFTVNEKYDGDGEWCIQDGFSKCRVVV